MKMQNKTNNDVWTMDMSIQKGITIIALIITIIIMLILSGIVISLAIRKNGIFKITKQGVKNYTNEQIKEETQIKNVLNYIDDNTIDENIEVKSGLYCTNGSFIPWNELVSKYGLNIEKDYTDETYEEETSAYSVFSKNNFQGKLIIDKSVKKIGNLAFARSTGLMNVIIPNSVIEIGDSAFNKCTELTNIDIPNSVISICNNAFSNCTNLINVSIPDTITYIGAYAFRKCTKLETLYIPSSAINTGKGSLTYECSSDLEIYCGATSKPSGWYDRWNYYSDSNTSLSYWNVTKQEYEEYLKTGQLISDTNLRHVNKNIKKIIIPNSITEIGDSAFNKCTELTNIDIPNSVISICNNAFSNCTNLINVNIPDTITYIGAYAFRKCTKLETLYIPSSAINTGKGSLIYECSSDLKIYCGATSKPSGWYSRWNYYSSSSTVSATWGITREQYNSNYKRIV